jgi:hypothetical protein
MSLRCERCWSEEGVAAFSIRTDSEAFQAKERTQAYLCASCRVSAPRSSLLFEKLFLRFASRKEFLLRYGEDESTAILRWCKEVGLDPAAADRLLSDGSGTLGLRLRRSHERTRRTAPYGYTHDGEGLVPATAEAKVVRQIFALYLGGSSLEEIAQSLNSRGVPAKSGGDWHKSTVDYILRNPLYIGYRRRKGSVKACSHPPLVDPRSFELVQALLRHRRSQKAISETAPESS